VLLLPNETITFTRGESTAPDATGWRGADASPDTFAGILANVQPLTAKEKLMLPEQDRERESRIILVDLGTYTPQIDDVATLASDSSAWLVAKIETMPENILGHHEIVAFKVGT